jgi:hypothetical protein
MADTLERLLRPRVVFGTLAVILLVIFLLLPEDVDPEVAGGLSSLSYRPTGVRGWYEGSERLGWKVVRNERRYRGTLDTARVYIVLQPSVPPTASEVGALLAAVRGGAGLIVSSERGTPMADSLHVVSDQFQWGGYPVVGGTYGMPRDPDVIALEPDREVLAPAPVPASETEDDEADTTTFEPEVGEIYDPGEDSIIVDTITARARRRGALPAGLDEYAGKVRRMLRANRPLADDTVAFLSVFGLRNQIQPTTSPAVLGIPKGKGRIVVLSDPHILRNQLLDEEDLVVLPQRLLEWAAPSPGATIEFDEYHQGAGRHGDPIRVVSRALGETPPGRMALQLALAGLVLLLALGTRPILPRSRARFERRSPLEHVGALARAYAQAGATRLAARRLAHGIRRRHGAAQRSGDDESFLRRLAERHPTIRNSIERLIAATRQPLPPREFTLLADDIDTIERTLTT